MSRVEHEDSALVFARNFFRNPRMLGSVIPSSRYLVANLLRDVDWERARVIVELGPGVGTISREILKRMRPDAVLLAFEINDDFVRLLKQNFTDPRFRVLHRSGAQVMDALRELRLGEADVIIAGIPFSIMTEHDRMEVLRNCHDALTEGGVMLVYQFSAKVRVYLEKLFGRVHRVFEPRNILPAQLFRCVKA
ncbi:MAG: class I SAM-dependent methyltransferase [Thermoanaerobaculia bacterium]